VHTLSASNACVMVGVKILRLNQSFNLETKLLDLRRTQVPFPKILILVLRQSVMLPSNRNTAHGDHNPDV